MNARHRVLLALAVLLGGCASPHRPRPAPRAIVLAPRQVASPVDAAPLGNAPRAVATPSATPPVGDVTPAPAAHDSLNATLWTQSAVEFRALALLSYRAATAMLDVALADTTWTAALEQVEQPGYSDLPPAVVLDLDETVLDSSPFMARLIRDDIDYSDEGWKAWVSEAAAEAVPGALAFTRAAVARGVRVIYLTNRDADEEAATRVNLARLGFPLSDDPDQVITQGEIPAWKPRDKGPRRAHVAKSHRILLLVGDNLTDFLSDHRADLAEREALFARHEARWGRSWIMLPNPQYGSWEAASYGGDYSLSAEERRAAKRALIRTR